MAKDPLVCQNPTPGAPRVPKEISLRVLVVNSNSELLPNPVVPLGACLAASAAEGAGHEVRFFDAAFEKDPTSSLKAMLGEFAPEAIGISIRNVDNTDYSSPKAYLPSIREGIVEPCLEAAPGRVVLGGAGFSTMPSEILEYMSAPAGVVGDGEIAFPALLEAWVSGSEGDGLPGVARLVDHVALPGPAPERPCELDRLPPSRSWQWVDLARYAAFGGAANIQTKRGCPLKCAYCVYNSVEGARYRLRSPSSVREEIALMADHGAADVEFTDSTFNLPVAHATAVLDEIISAGPRVRLHTAGMNPLGADRELFGKMARAGFRSIMISAESASGPALEGLGKGFGVDAVERMLELAAASPFDTFWYFLFGGPGETDRTVDETLSFIATRIPKRHLVYIGAGIRVQKGAPVQAIAEGEGLIRPGEDLLEPRFYFSPRVDRQRLFARIREEILDHPNYIQVRDYQGTDAPLKLARLLKMLRISRPSWAFVPMLNRIFSWMGKRRR